VLLLIDRVIVTDAEVEIRYVLPTSPDSEHVRFCHLRKDYFDHPPPRVDGKADLVGRLAHDLDGDDRRRGRFVAGVASIRKRFGHEGERAPGQAQHRNRSVAILDVSGLGFEDQAAPVRVDHDLALAALHL
jgi:site-specific DNA recombinase